jgi:WD40 repeat protein
LDPQAGSLFLTLQSHTSDVYALTVLQNGNLASGSLDSSVKIWNTDSGALIRTLIHSDPVYSLAVLQNGYLASGSANSKVSIWDTASGLLVKEIDATSKVFSLVVIRRIVKL